MGAAENTSAKTDRFEID